MEPECDRVEDNNAGEEPEDDKAGEQSPATSTSVAPRRGLRERGVGRQKPRLPASSHTNGAVSGSGRVLRDRSTRTVPAWLKKDKSDEDEGQNTDAGASRRRKVACPRRQKNLSSASSTDNAGVSSQITDSAHTKKLTSILAPPTKQSQAQSRAKASTAWVAKAFAKPVCKSEPGTDTLSVEGEGKVLEKIDDAIEKKEEDREEDYTVLEVEDPRFQDDQNDLTYQPQSREEEELSSDEDFPFSDDLNDQSYEPNSERDAPKPKRRATSRQREKKERVPAKDTEGDDEKLEIKIEGGESMEDVKLEEEFGDEVQEGPRKRGRRRKDDTTPRLPKRRKKPPVQYVRCEMEGCGTVLAHPRYLQHHIKYQHLLKKKYVCPHPSCGRLFRLQKQLLRHAKHHTDQRDYICEFCARAFKSSHNLAVHRMIHTGEKPLQCEICGFTCRQKASLNWHMKKHDADATYQFSCSICGKKFEKKDCVVAHKAKSHPEVLIAEALAANSGGLITTPASLLGVQGNPVPAEVNVGQQGQVAPHSQVGPINQQAAQAGQLAQQVGQVSHQVVLLGQDQSLHAMQVPVTIALSPIDPPSPADNQQTHLQLQMPLHFVQTAAHTQQQQPQPQIQQLTLHPGPVVTQPQQLPLQAYTSQQQQHGQPQILHMTFQPVSQSQTHVQQIPMLASSQQLQTVTTSSSLLSQAQSQEATSTSKESYILDTSRLTSSPSSAAGSLHQQQADAVMEEGVVWEPAGEEEVLTAATEGLVQQVLI